MSYIFKLTVEKEKSKLALLNDGSETAAREWPEHRDMGERLFEAIDGLLQEYGLKPEEVGDFIVKTDLSETFTSVRIAETVRRVYTFGVIAKYPEP